MSQAWEVTKDDVYLALRRMRKDTSDVQVSHYFEQINDDEVEDVILAYDDFDDQVEAALEEIERQIKRIDRE